PSETGLANKPTTSSTRFTGINKICRKILLLLKGCSVKLLKKPFTPLWLMLKAIIKKNTEKDIDSVMFGSTTGTYLKYSRPIHCAAPGIKSTGINLMEFIKKIQKKTVRHNGPMSLLLPSNVSLTWLSINS